ncbi:hypothetical protein M0802_004360 [Mischocyttarus mexicanus]|nr:hypothetical protein M0802_004360 [Mischocyttarus mexicanus]
MQEHHSVLVHHNSRLQKPLSRHHETVALLAIFAVALTQSKNILPAKENDNLSPVAAEENQELVAVGKRSPAAENEQINALSEAEEQPSELAERNKRGLLYSAAYTAPVAYTAYSAPYAYARSYAYPYVASPYRSYPYVLGSPYYF